MQVIKDENHGEFTKPNLIVVEGLGDAAFFRHLLTTHGLLDSFHIGYPDDITAMADDGKVHTGREGFGQYLLSFGPRTGSQLVKSITIVTDCDDSPQNAFDNACKHIGSPGRFEVPKKPFELTGSTPSVAVVLIPNTTDQGNLETFLLKGRRASADLDVCLEEFFKCCKYQNLPAGIASKKMMTVLVASWIDDNPSCTLGNIWSSKYIKNNPISIDTPDFKKLADFLGSTAERSAKLSA